MFFFLIVSIVCGCCFEVFCPVGRLLVFYLQFKRHLHTRHGKDGGKEVAFLFPGVRTQLNWGVLSSLSFTFYFEVPCGNDESNRLIVLDVVETTKLLFLCLCFLLPVIVGPS